MGEKAPFEKKNNGLSKYLYTGVVLIPPTVTVSKTKQRSRLIPSPERCVYKHVLKVAKGKEGYKGLCTKYLRSEMKLGLSNLDKKRRIKIASEGRGCPALMDRH